MDHQDWHQDQWRRQPMRGNSAGEPAPGSGYTHNPDWFQDDDWSVERSRIERQQGPRRRWQPLAAVLAALIVIAGAVGGLGVYTGHWFSLAGRPSAHATATPRPIQPLLLIDTSMSETCPTGAAWSPDGLKIAVAADGEQPSCDPADPRRTRTVTLYDARSGAQLKRFSMYITLQQLKITASNAYAGQPSWSPDGSTIVVPFALLDTTGQHSGLLVIPVDHGSPRVLVDMTDAQEVQPIWNLKTGKLVAVQTAALPQALTYQWSARGTIQPGEPVPSGDSTAYTGSPVQKPGSTNFSRWQSGLIEPVSREGYVGVPLAWFHSDAGALWSPDGQYVAPTYSIETRLPEPAGGNASSAHAPGLRLCRGHFNRSW